MRLLAIVLLCPFLVHAQIGKVTVRVTDYDTGMVITNAKVEVGFNTNIKPGWGWGGSRPNDKVGYTGADGLCTLTGRGNGASVGMAVFKEQYYGNSGYSFRFTNTTGIIRRKWQPWNPTIHVVMKRIINPIPLYYKHVGIGQCPEEGKPIGFDLIEGDWVAPHGRGKHGDFLFTLIRKPERIVQKIVNNRTYDEILYDLTLTVRGAGEGDGFIPLPLPVRQGGSSLHMPRMAPAAGYQPAVSVRDYRDHIDKPFHNTADEDMNYFFRVRTVLDEEGEVESALYGKIRGDFQLDHRGEFGFTYYLNPNPNDRNLEFDRDRNLFNLPVSERVSRP